MKIEIATIEDVPELMELHDKAFFAIAAEVNWLDAPGLKESLEQALEDFPKYMTLKMLSDEGKIVGSVRGRVEEGSLYIGRLMVLPECQKNGYGRILLREIQSMLPHSRTWLDTSGDVPETVSFYEREGFRTFESKRFENGVSWIFMEKSEARVIRRFYVTSELLRKKKSLISFLEVFVHEFFCFFTPFFRFFV